MPLSITARYHCKVWAGQGGCDMQRWEEGPLPHLPPLSSLSLSLSGLQETAVLQSCRQTPSESMHCRWADAVSCQAQIGQGTRCCCCEISASLPPQRQGAVNSTLNGCVGCGRAPARKNGRTHIHATVLLYRWHSGQVSGAAYASGRANAVALVFSAIDVATLLLALTRGAAPRLARRGRKTNETEASAPPPPRRCL